MPQFGELLKSLAGKAGIKTEDETLKKMLSFTEVMQQEVPEEFSKPLEQNLLTEESARANPNVRSTLFAEALNGADSELDRLVQDVEFDDVFKGEYKAIQKNTNEKARRIALGIKKLTGELKEKVKTASKNPKNDQDEKEIQTLNKEIERLNRQAEDLKLMQKTELENLRTQNLNEKKNFILRSSLAGKPLPKNGIPQDVNILTAETLVKQAMAKEGLQLFIDEFGNPFIKQRKDGADIDYFVDNKKVDYSNFLDGVLAQNKFVQINDPAPTTGVNGNTLPVIPGNPTNQSIVDETAKMLASMGTQV